MMRRVTGRVLEALGGREAGCGRGSGRLAHLLPPVVGLESSVITPRERERERERWGGALLRRRDARLGEGLPGCSRGFAAGHGGPRSGGGGRGRGGGGDGAAELTSRISGAVRVEDILELVTSGAKLNFIHVATAMNKLVRAAKRGTGERSWKLEGNRLRRDPKFTQLIDLVRSHCPSFAARAGANVLHALAVLHVDLGIATVDEGLAALLGEFVERESRDMNPQAVANSLNALSKLEAAAAAVSPSGWKRLAEAAERTALDMNPQAVANSLNALSKIEAAAAVSPTGWARLAEAAERTAGEMIPQGVANTLNALCNIGAAAAAVSPTGWAGLAQAAGRTAREMNSQDVANMLNALCTLEAAAAAVSPTGWAGVAEAAERTSRDMNPQDVANTLNALCKLEAAAAEVSQSGWAGLAQAAERTASQMNDQDVSNSLYALGVLPAAAAELSPSARKHLEAAAEREAPNMTLEGRWMTLRGCAKLELRTPSALSE